MIKGRTEDDDVLVDVQVPIEANLRRKAIMIDPGHVVGGTVHAIRTHQIVNTQTTTQTIPLIVNTLTGLARGPIQGPTPDLDLALEDTEGTTRIAVTAAEVDLDHTQAEVDHEGGRIPGRILGPADHDQDLGHIPDHAHAQGPVPDLPIDHIQKTGGRL